MNHIAENQKDYRDFFDKVAYLMVCHVTYAHHTFSRAYILTG